MCELEKSIKSYEDVVEILVAIEVANVVERSRFERSKGFARENSNVMSN